MKTEGEATGNQAKPGDGHEKYFYFVDGEKFDSESQFTTGAIIKSRLAEPMVSALTAADSRTAAAAARMGIMRMVAPEKEKGPKRFYTVPPASFGAE